MCRVVISLLINRHSHLREQASIPSRTQPFPMAATPPSMERIHPSHKEALACSTTLLYSFTHSVRMVIPFLYVLQDEACLDWRKLSIVIHSKVRAFWRPAATLDLDTCKALPSVDRRRFVVSRMYGHNDGRSAHDNTQQPDARYRSQARGGVDSHSRTNWHFPTMNLKPMRLY